MTGNQRAAVRRLPERFWSRVDRSSDCWIWTASRDRGGYGRFSMGKGSDLRAHRVALLLTGRPAGHNEIVRHSCDNPPCVRPDHLLIGTHADNAHDRDVRLHQVPGPGGAHRLTLAEVQRVRELLAAGARRCDVADQVGLTPRSVTRIKSGHTWANQ